MLLESKRTKVINIWLQFQKMCILVNQMVQLINTTIHIIKQLKWNQNIKSILQKVRLKIGLKRFLSLKKLNILYRGHMFILIIMEKKFLGLFLKKNCEKQIRQFRFEKVIKRRGEKLCVIWKVYDNFLTAG